VYTDGVICCVVAVMLSLRTADCGSGNTLSLTALQSAMILRDISCTKMETSSKQDVH